MERRLNRTSKIILAGAMGATVLTINFRAAQGFGSDPAPEKPFDGGKPPALGHLLAAYAGTANAGSVAPLFGHGPVIASTTVAGPAYDATSWYEKLRSLEKPALVVDG